MRSWKVQASHVRACAATGGGLWGPVASKWGHRDAGASYWTLCVWAQLPEGSTSYIYIYVSLYACSCCGSPCCSARKAEGWEYVGAVCLICVAGQTYTEICSVRLLCVPAGNTSWALLLVGSGDVEHLPQADSAWHFLYQTAHLATEKSVTTHEAQRSLSQNMVTNQTFKKKYYITYPLGIRGISYFMVLDKKTLQLLMIYSMN